MKSKRIIAATFAVMITLAALYIILPGLSKRGDVYVTNYSVSEDGTEMMITVGVSTSVGYVRKISEHQQQGGRLYLDCYSAFGGINGSLGAKNEYTIQIAEDTEIIALYRSVNCYASVLEKNETGAWQYVKAE